MEKIINGRSQFKNDILYTQILTYNLKSLCTNLRLSNILAAISNKNFPFTCLFLSSENQLKFVSIFGIVTGMSTSST